MHAEHMAVNQGLPVSHTEPMGKAWKKQTTHTFHPFSHNTMTVF